MLSDQEISDTMNKLTAMIDEKATLFKDERFDMPAVRKKAEQTMLLKLIDDALGLAEKVNPRPADLIRDFQRLQRDITAF